MWKASQCRIVLHCARMQRRRRRDFLGGAMREIVFGLEDSLVSTLGAVTGVAVGSGDRYVIVLSGLVLVAVEAISMSAGSFLSTQSAEEVSRERQRQDSSRILQERMNDDESLQAFLVRKGLSKKEMSAALDALSRERRLWLKEVHRAERRIFTSGIHPVAAAFVMGGVYLVGGVLVFLPYFFLPIAPAAALSFVIAGVALFSLGVWKAQVAGVGKVRSGAQMVAVSLVAAALGMAVGRVASLTLL